MHSSDSGYQMPPFPAFPSTDRYIPLGSIQDAVQRLDRSIQAKDAISMVIGPPGTGKTLICRLLSDQYRRSHQVITLGETPFADVESFLRRILHQLGGDLSLPSADFQLAIFDYLCLHDPSDAGLLLLIDEAQSLSAELLETIRTLTNLTRNGEPRVSIVLAGGNGLDELLIAPAMDGFRQRISTRCYLHPLNGEETSWYINQTIRNCGCEPDATITSDAIAAVHHACSGVPRLVNQLLTHAIEYAAQHDQYLLTDQIIEQAWAELQSLPSPMINEPDLTLNAPDVEFGELDALPDAAQPDASPLTSEASELNIDSSVNERFSDAASKLSTETTIESSQRSSFADDLESFDFEPAPEFWPSEALDSDQPVREPFTSPASELEFPELACPALSDNLDTDHDPEITGFETDLLDTDLSTPEEPDAETADSVGNLSEEPQPTLSNEILFGTFDQEEPVDVHRESEANTATHQIESVMHEEIVGITEIPLDPTAGSPGILPEVSAQDSQNPTLKILSADQDQTDSPQDGFRTDDSDLLIIEDEVELRRIDKPQTTQESGQPMSIDYQKLLSRMRSRE